MDPRVILALQIPGAQKLHYAQVLYVHVFLPIKMSRELAYTYKSHSTDKYHPHG